MTEDNISKMFVAKRKIKHKGGEDAMNRVMTWLYKALNRQDKNANARIHCYNALQCWLYILFTTLTHHSYLISHFGALAWAHFVFCLFFGLKWCDGWFDFFFTAWLTDNCSKYPWKRWFPVEETGDTRYKRVQQPVTETGAGTEFPFLIQRSMYQVVPL